MLILMLGCVLPEFASADLGLNVYGLSWHLDRDKARELNVDNWFNPGLGLRYRLVEGEGVDWFFDAGVYRDSGRNTAALAGAAGYWKVSTQGRIGAALAILHSETYNDGKTFLAPLPMAAYDFGPAMLNVAYMPKFREFNHINTLGFWLTYWLK